MKAILARMADGQFPAGRSLLRPALVALLVLSLACGDAVADEITEWNQTALDVMRTEGTSPPRVPYNLSIMHISIFDALNSITGRYTPISSRLYAGSGEVSERAAVVSAANSCLKALFPERAASFDQQMAQNLAVLPQSDAVARGVLLGQAAAAATIQWRYGDGTDGPSHYIPTDAPGHWRPTPPNYAPPLEPQWGYVRPFTGESLKQFVPPPPPALDSAEYAAALQQVQEIGGRVSSVRTADQTEVAEFWNDNPGVTATPPGKWNVIAQTLSAQQNNTLEDNARMFALLNMAMADTGTVSWYSKFHYDMWRPEDAIRLADLDGNPLTEADPEWEPLWASPPFPTYTSGHSSFSAAGSEVLIRFFGTDDIAFEIPAGWEVLPGVMREYDSISMAAEEAGMSRIYGGIHFMFDHTYGLSSGRAIGNYTFENNARLIPELLTVLAWTMGMAALGCYGRRRRNRQRRV